MPQGFTGKLVGDFSGRLSPQRQKGIAELARMFRDDAKWEEYQRLNMAGLAERHAAGAPTVVAVDGFSHMAAARDAGFPTMVPFLTVVFVKEVGARALERLSARKHSVTYLGSKREVEVKEDPAGVEVVAWDPEEVGMRLGTISALDSHHLILMSLRSERHASLREFLMTTIDSALVLKEDRNVVLPGMK